MNWNKIPERKDEPNFENLLEVLQREVPDRPTFCIPAVTLKTSLKTSSKTCISTAATPTKITSCRPRKPTKNIMTVLLS